VFQEDALNNHLHLKCPACQQHNQLYKTIAKVGGAKWWYHYCRVVTLQPLTL